MIEVLTHHNINEILESPKEYVDNTQDLALVRKDKTFVLIGMDEDGIVYFVVEDDKTSEDRYVCDFYPGMTLQEAFDSIMEEIKK